MSAKQNIPSPRARRPILSYLLSFLIFVSYPSLVRADSLEDAAQAASANARMREALSVSLDRGTMAGVLLQKQAEPATALLPQWLSGYAFLFTVDTNLDRAKEMPAAQSLLAPQANAAGAHQ